VKASGRRSWLPCVDDGGCAIVPLAGWLLLVFRTLRGRGPHDPPERAPAMLERTSSEQKQYAADGLPPEQRRWAILAIFTALALSALDSAIANFPEMPDEETQKRQNARDHKTISRKVEFASPRGALF
jgi:hypothetical protein